MELSKGVPSARPLIGAMEMSIAMCDQRVTVRFNAQVIEKTKRACSSVQILTFHATQKLIMERLVRVGARALVKTIQLKN